MPPTPPDAPVTSTGPCIRLEAAILERDHRHRRGEAGRPDRHRVARREPGRQRHDPAGRHALVLAVAAVARDAEVVAVGEDRRPDRERPSRALADHLAGQVDPGDERADPGDLAVRAGRQAVLVVDARPGDPDLDLARRQVGLGEVADAALDAVVRPSRRRRRGTLAGMAVIGLILAVREGCVSVNWVDGSRRDPAPSRTVSHTRYSWNMCMRRRPRRAEDGV